MKKITITSLIALALFTSCKNNTAEKEEPTATTETTQEEMTTPQDDWQTLFDGSSLDSWKAYNKDSISSQWKVENDMLVFTPSDSYEGSENLISKDTYTNFVLSLEWKVSEGGNSGVMWAVKESEDLNEPYLSGPEIQVLDDERHPDAKAGITHRSGALYDMLPAKEGVVKPAGEWNSYEITINYEENKGVVVMNGEEVVKFPVQGEEWDAMVAESKFADWSEFGKHKTGHIALQDHGNKVSYRNIKIKELK